MKSKSKKSNSPSKVNEPVLQLRSYTGFDKNDLKNIAQQNTCTINSISDLKSARKCRTAVNKEMIKIKKVHTDNKRSINQFKKD